MVPLRDLGEWAGGNTPSKANAAYWTDGTIPWVSPKDMKVDEITSSEDRITETALSEGRVSLVPEGSVLFVTRSGILSHTLPVAVTKLPVTINQDLKALTPWPGVSPKYVAHAVRGASRRILEKCSKHGTTVASIETSALLDFEIPLVELDEQHRIVAEIEKQFSRVDEAVANLKRVKANLKRYKATILKAAVEGRLVPTEAELGHRERRGYEHGTELLKLVLETRRKKWEGAGKYREPSPIEVKESAPLPQGWCWCTVDQLAEVGTGATPNRGRSDYYERGDVPWVTSAAVNKPYVDRPSEFVTRTALDETNLTLYPAGTLVVAMYGEGKTRGKCSELRISAATNQALAALQVDAKLRPYLKLFLEHNYEGMRSAASGGVQPNLNLGLVRAVRVPLPPVLEQQRIVNEAERRLTVVEAAAVDLDANTLRAESMRMAILSAQFEEPIASAEE